MLDDRILVISRCAFRASDGTYSIELLCEEAADESIATRSPKSSITLGVDATHGDYEVELAVEALAEKLRK